VVWSETCNRHGGVHAVRQMSASSSAWCTRFLAVAAGGLE
jgi:hypothetical protein